jgi:hypothetical protein
MILTASIFSVTQEVGDIDNWAKSIEKDLKVCNLELEKREKRNR